MINPANPVTPSPVASTIDLAQGRVAPFVFDLVSKTILKLEGIDLSLNQQAQVPLTNQTLAAMQQLVDLIHRLRSVNLPVSEQGTVGQHTKAQAAETIAPYVSEEAHEVLDALRADQAASSASDAHVTSLSPCLISVDSLIPYLLWCVARSSYTAMQLIEGVRASRLQSDNTWAVGMLRLVVMLEAQSETVHWCFDLATEQLSPLLLNHQERIQSDETSLPVQKQPNSKAGEHYDQTTTQLQALIEQIQETTPTLGRLLDGIPVEMLQPGEDWQHGKLHLKLGFEFSQGSHNVAAGFCLAPANLVEAELLEDGVDSIKGYFSQRVAGSHPFGTATHSTTQVSIRELPHRSLNAATLIRLAGQELLKRHTATSQQQAMSGLFHLRQLRSTADSEETLLHIIQTAFDLAHTSDYANYSCSLIQPELLMDELVPKLLWQMTRSSYEVMQLIGGVKAQVLQPGLTWETGTLRLVLLLHLKAAGIDHKIDLASSRFLPTHPSLLTPAAICQMVDAPYRFQSHTGGVNQNPIQISPLKSYLAEQIRAATPEVTLFLDGVAIEWLEAEQDWQAGTLQLNLELEFTPIIPWAVSFPAEM